MTPYLLCFDAQDQKHRKLLEAHYRKLHDRTVPFPFIATNRRRCEQMS